MDIGNYEKTTSQTAISLSEYQLIREYISSICAIELGANKQYLVQNRLMPLLKKFEMRTFQDLIDAIQSSGPQATRLKSAFIDAMTTNETYWFRDRNQYTELEETILPELFNTKAGTIKVWSAACSTGQEAYSISMVAEQVITASGKNKNIQIIGTDISETVIEDAKNAEYSDLSLSRGLRESEKERFFLKAHSGFKLTPEITQKVRFQQFNLLKPFLVLGNFDIIFCRNVLIYFSNEVKRDILKRLWGSLENGGILFLSSTESIPEDMQEFEIVNGRARYFRKR